VSVTPAEVKGEVWRGRGDWPRLLARKVGHDSTKKENPKGLHLLVKGRGLGESSRGKKKTWGGEAKNSPRK